MNGVKTTLNRLRARYTSSSPSDQARSSAQPEGLDGKTRRPVSGLFQKALKKSFGHAGRLLHIRGHHATVPDEVTQGEPSFRVLSTFKAGQEEMDARHESNASPHLDKQGELRMDGSLAGLYMQGRLADHGPFQQDGEKKPDELSFRDKQRGLHFHVVQTPNMAGAVRSSRPSPSNNSYETRPSTPGHEHFGVISGVHISSDEHQYRLQGTQVHQYDDQKNCWLPLTKATQYKRIARNADGNVYGTPTGALDVSVSPKGYRFDLHRDNNSNVIISELPSTAQDFAEGNVTGISLRLKQTNNHDFHATRIAHASEDTLYAINKENELFISDPLPVAHLSKTDKGDHNKKVPQEEQTYFYLDNSDPEGQIRTITDRSGRVFEEPEDSRVNTLTIHHRDDREYPGVVVTDDGPLSRTRETVHTVTMKEVNLASLKKKFNGSIKVEGFIHDHENQLNLLIKDRHEKLHNILIHDDGRFGSGWNLTDAIVMTNVQGLSKLVKYDQTIDLGRRGNLALDNKTLLVQGADNANWNSTPIYEVDKLDHGLDNMAYVLRHGKVKQLDVTHTESRMAVDDMYELSPNQRRTVVTLGHTIIGSKSSNIKSFAVVDEHHFLILNEQNELTAHVDGRRVKLPFGGSSNTLRDIAIDGAQTLHVLDNGGGLHSLARNQWQRLRPDPEQWQQTAIPAAETIEGLTTSATGRLIATVGKQRPELKSDPEGKLKFTGKNKGPLTTIPEDASIDESITGAASDSMAPADKQRFELKSDSAGKPQWQPIKGALRKEPLYGGQSAQQHSKLQNNYEPTSGTQHGNGYTSNSHNVLGSAGNGLDVRKHHRFFSNAVSHMHSIKKVQKVEPGHSYLQELHKEEQALVKLLLELTDKKPHTAVNPLENRVKKLQSNDNEETALPLLESLKTQGQKLADRSHDIIILLGEIHKAGSEPMKQGNNSSALATFQKRTLKQRRPNMLSDMLSLLTQYPVTADNPAARTLERLLNNGLYIEYSDALDMPDRRDPSVILRASLIQNCDAIIKLHRIATRLDQLNNQLSQDKIILSSKADSIPELEKDFDRLIYDELEDSELQQYAAANFSSYRGLEKINKVHEAFKRNLGIAGRALNTHLKAEFNSEDLPGTLTEQIRSMQEGDTTNVSTEKEIAFSTPIVFMPIPVPVYTIGSFNSARTAGMKITRRPEGATIALSASSNFNSSNTWGMILAASDVTNEGPSRPVNNGFYSGADLVGKYTRSTQDALSMNVHGSDIHRVMNHFSRQDARLLDILKIGRESSVSHASTHQAQLDFSLTPIDLRLNMGDSGPGVWFRSAIGLSVDISLINYAHEEQESYGPGGAYEQRTSNKIDYLSRTSGNAFVRPAQFVASTDKPETFMRAIAEVSSTITLDRSQTVAYHVSFKTPPQLTKESFDNLVKAIKQAFPDKKEAINQISGASSSVSKQHNINKNKNEEPFSPESFSKQFETLLDYADSNLKVESQNEEQHTVLHKLAQLKRQKKALDLGIREFSSATRKLSLPSAKAWRAAKDKTQAESASIVPAGRLRKYVDSHLKEVRDRAQLPWLKGVSQKNHSIIKELITQQPRFAAVIRALEGKNTAAEAEFELKPSVREALEDRALNNEENIGEALRKALQDPDNLRIRSISVSHTVSAPSTFATPPFLIGFRSEARLEHTQQRGIIEFEYGIDPDRPIVIRLGGGFALEDNDSSVHARLLRRDVGFHYLSSTTPPSDEDPGHMQNTSDGRGPSYRPVTRANQGPL